MQVRVPLEHFWHPLLPITNPSAQLVHEVISSGSQDPLHFLAHFTTFPLSARVYPAFTYRQIVLSVLSQTTQPVSQSLAQAPPFRLYPILHSLQVLASVHVLQPCPHGRHGPVP